MKNRKVFSMPAIKIESISQRFQAMLTKIQMTTIYSKIYRESGGSQSFFRNPSLQSSKRRRKIGWTIHTRTATQNFS